MLCWQNSLSAAGVCSVVEPIANSYEREKHAVNDMDGMRGEVVSWVNCCVDPREEKIAIDKREYYGALNMFQSKHPMENCNFIPL